MYQDMFTAITQSPSQMLPRADIGDMALTSTDIDVDLFTSNVDNFDYSVLSSTTHTSVNTNTTSSVQTPSPQPSRSTATTASLPVWENFFSHFAPMDPALAADLVCGPIRGESMLPATYDDWEDLFITPNVGDKAQAAPENHHCLQVANPPYPERGFTEVEDPAFISQLIKPRQRATVQGTCSSHSEISQLDLIAGQPPAPSCGPCIVEALDLMSQLVHNNPGQHCTGQPDRATGASALLAKHAFEAIAVRNEAVVDACIAMLKCPCSGDGYLLAVIALIVFKVLAWYAATVQPSPPAECHQSVAMHLGAQLVLGKMHRVQQLVNQLSAKLKAKRLEGSGVTDTDRLGAVGGLPLSGLVLEQLEVDLRKRLREVTLEIIGHFRGGESCGLVVRARV